MIVRTLGRTGYRVSAVAYGGIVSMNDSQADSDRYVAYAVEQGVNYFDVAPTYGDAQQKLGQSLIPYRDRVYLACKTAQRRRREAEQDLRRSMELLRTDHFDVYQLHGLSTDE
ncbi:MAG: aldo/keto reductase, partial [Clostridia bacterium]|nr:aldo/keto reductase [Clostridia bacterium]